MIVRPLNKEQNVILCDVDGVLANFVQGMIDSHGWDIGHDDYTSWNHHRELGLSDTEFWEPTNDGKWWLGLQPYDGSQDFVAGLRELGKVIFCTSPNQDASCPSQKVQWLRNHGFLGATSTDYQIGPNKHLNAGSGAILLDDSESNVSEFVTAGGWAVGVPRPWNDYPDRTWHELKFELAHLAVC